MMTLTRRGFGRTALGAALASQAAIPSARATTTMARTDRLQGAGFYRFPLGDKTLTVLADGMSEFPGADLFAVNVPADEFVATQSHLFEPTGHVDFHMNQLLVEAGDRRILIDAGPGGFMGADFGRQGLALENAGVDPATIDTVVITHGHPDHYAGLVGPDGGLRFPNARVVWDRREHAFWSSEAATAALRRSALPQGFIEAFIGAAQAVLPATRAMNDFVEGETEIAPGIVLLEAPGHTPHSSVVLVSDGDEQLLYASDTTLLPAQNALRPEWVSAFEMDPEGVVRARRRLLDRAAADRLLSHAYHEAFPATGPIRAAGGAYEWVAASWRW